MLAVDLMTRFAERTGLMAERPRAAAPRYLWTDAFAVCNFVGLGQATGDPRFLALARRLVDQVHHTLGRHRGDDARTGWISGLDEAEGEAHPTRGGLRIGKPHPERTASEPLIDRLEWDRDGQYFHYLTRWMHALDQLARVTGDPIYSGHALELAAAAHRGFVHGPRGRRRMSWKLSIDLSRPLVASMGHHDPLDGYVTALELEATRRRLASRGPELGAAIAEYRAMIEPESLATADPLGLGGLLIDAHRLAQLGSDRELREALLTAAEIGLDHLAAQRELDRSAEQRLAFRELGLAIGLAAVPALGIAPRFARFAALRPAIEAFWRDPGHRQGRLWREHADINDVMLATSLSPDGFLVLHGLAPPPRPPAGGPSTPAGRG
jgi:hypothetical protein